MPHIRNAFLECHWECRNLGIPYTGNMVYTGNTIYWEHLTVETLCTGNALYWEHLKLGQK